MGDVVVKLQNVTKFYKLYDCPKKRMKEALNPFRKEYHKKHFALSNINLEIKKGDILGVLGRNGCGKSTLLKLMTGVLQASEGSISVNGKITALLELGAGFNPEFTGIENVRFYANILGLTHSEIDQKLPDIIEFAELGEFLGQPVKTYSSGMKSRLGFAVAAHVDPEILVLDEVLAVGDDAFKAKCFRKISEFLEKSKTVIIVSHSIHTINQLCNRAVLIQDGQIVADGLPKDVTQEYHRALFGGEPEALIANTPLKKASIISPKASWDDSIILNPVSMLQKEQIKTTGFVMTDEAGLSVNVLEIDQKYSFSFVAELTDQIIDRVLFGVTFVTSKGIHVCGIQPKLKKKLADKLYEFSADFQCIFNEDIYTLIVASRIRSAEVLFYSRVEDVGAYKVINLKSDYRWGLVQL